MLVSENFNRDHYLISIGRMSEVKNVEELRKYSFNFLKYINYSLAKLIEHILSYSYLPSKTEIAKDLGIPPYELSRRLSILRKLNFMLSINIDICAINLSRLIIISKSSINIEELTPNECGRFLNFYSPIILPFNGTLLIYYMPYGLDVSDFTSRLKNIVSYDVVVETLYSKAKLTEHFDFINKTFKVNWSRLHNLVDEYLKRVDEVGIRDVRKCSKVKYDSLDLLIIKELEKDPFRPLVEISKELNINYAKILRHYNQHVSKIVKGFKLRAIPLPPEASLYIVLGVKSDSRVLNALAKALTELVHVGAIYLASNSMYIFLVCDQVLLNELIKFITNYVSNYDVYLLDRSRRVAFTIPYTEYSKFLRYWVI